MTTETTAKAKAQTNFFPISRTNSVEYFKDETQELVRLKHNDNVIAIGVKEVKENQPVLKLISMEETRHPSEQPIDTLLAMISVGEEFLGLDHSNTIQVNSRENNVGTERLKQTAHYLNQRRLVVE